MYVFLFLGYNDYLQLFYTYIEIIVVNKRSNLKKHTFKHILKSLQRKKC